MTSKARMLAVLDGRQADCLPLCPNFDRDYMIKAAGWPVQPDAPANNRDELWHTLTNDQRGTVVERCFRRHPQMDLLFCPTGQVPPELVPTLSPQPSAAALAELVPAPPDTQAFVDHGLYAYHARLQRTIGREALLAFTVNVPLGSAVRLCGGYQEGLVAMLQEPAAFAQAYLKLCQWVLPRIRAGAAAGLEAVWITQYWAGADTISPRLYRDLVLPGEQLIFEEARRCGLRTLFWFIGHLLPMIPDIMHNRPDALVLEPGRKGYTVDIGAIRAAAGKRVCLCACPEELAFTKGDTACLAADIRAQCVAAGPGPLAATTPILKTDTALETVDAYFQVVRQIPVRG